MKYQRFTQSGCKNIEIRKFMFVTKTQLLCFQNRTVENYAILIQLAKSVQVPTRQNWQGKLAKSVQVPTRQNWQGKLDKSVGSNKAKLTGKTCQISAGSNKAKLTGKTCQISASSNKAKLTGKTCQIVLARELSQRNFNCSVPRYE